MADDREEQLEQGPAPRPRVSRSQQRRRQHSVFQYITILFAAALVLLFYTFMMERRQYEQLQQENQENIDNLQQSVSSVQRLEGLIAENEQLKKQLEAQEQQLDELQDQLDAAEEEYGLLRAEVQGEQRSGVAMEYFWQIDEAYVRGRTRLCRELITQLEEGNFQNDLPKDNTTGTDRFSPYDRYLEIREKVIK